MYHHPPFPAFFYQQPYASADIAVMKSERELQDELDRSVSRVDSQKAMLQRFLTDREMSFRNLGYYKLYWVTLSGKKINRQKLLNDDPEGAEWQFRRILTLLETLKKCSTVEIKHFKLTSEQMLEVISACKLFIKLTEFRLKNIHLELVCVGFINQFIQVKNITCLKLTSCGMKNSSIKILESGLRALKNLECLCLRNNFIGNTGAKIIANIIQNNPNNLELDLHNNRIKNEGAKVLMQSLLSVHHLLYIELSKNLLTFQGMRAVAHIAASGRWLAPYGIDLILYGNTKPKTEQERMALKKDIEGSEDNHVFLEFSPKSETFDTYVRLT